MKAPTVGRSVIALGGVAVSNGTDIAPAVVTRVWGEHPAGRHIINLRVFPDATSAVPCMTSVSLFDTEEQAREFVGDTSAVAAYWPTIC